MTKLRTYIVQVFQHLDDYVFRAFDPERCTTYRCQIHIRQLLARLAKQDCPLAPEHKIMHEMGPVHMQAEKEQEADKTDNGAVQINAINGNSKEGAQKPSSGESAVVPPPESRRRKKPNPDADGKPPVVAGLTRTALSWLTTRMVIQERYLMQAYWKSALFDEGVMVLDQAEDVMACKIQSCWRHRTARARLYDEVCRLFRKYWSAEYQCYYYVHIEYPDEQLWERPWLIDVCFRAYCACDKLSLDRLSEIPRNPYKRKLYMEADKVLETRVLRYREYYANVTNGRDFGEIADIPVLDVWDKLETPEGVMYWNGSRDVYSRFSEDEASDLIANFYKRNITAELRLPSLAHLARSVMFHRRVEADYDRRPDSLAAVLNYALLMHTVRCDVAKAKVLYEEAYRMSSSNPTVLYCYGLFVLGNRDFKYREPQGNKGHKLIQDAMNLDDRREKFQTAEDTFFRAAVLLNPTSAPALRNLALVFQVITEDFKAADRFYARSLALDMYDESTQVNYLDFLDELRHASLDAKGRPVKAGKYRLAGPTLEIKSASELLCYADGNGWERWSNPAPRVRSHRTFWYNPGTARARWLSPYWEPRGFNKEEETIMKAKKRVVLAGERYRKKRAPSLSPSAALGLGSWAAGDGGGYELAGGEGVLDPGAGAEGDVEGGGKEITGELDPTAQAEMIAARVAHDMETVRQLLDGTHTKLAELELQTVKHSRQLVKRLDVTDQRTANYDHERAEYEIERLTREAAAQSERMAELTAKLEAQRKELERRDALYQEQGLFVKRVAGDMSHVEAVLTKKQQQQLAVRRKAEAAANAAAVAAAEGAASAPHEPTLAEAFMQHEHIGAGGKEEEPEV